MGEFRDRLVNGTLTISGKGEMPDFDDTLGKSWYHLCDYITTVNIQRLTNLDIGKLITIDDGPHEDRKGKAYDVEAQIHLLRTLLIH